MTNKQSQYGEPANYNATPPVYVDGDAAALSVDLNGNTMVTLATLINGEDPATQLMVVEQRYTYAAISTATTTVVKSSPGFIHSIAILGGTLGTITVYDNTTGSGTVICPTFTPTAAVPCPTIILNVVALTGITVVTGSATVLVVTYR